MTEPPRRRATDQDPESARVWIAGRYTGPWARLARLARMSGTPDGSRLARFLARRDDAWITGYASRLARPPDRYQNPEVSPDRE
jgi:hypothetical protein